MNPTLTQSQIDALGAFSPEQIASYNRFRATGFSPEKSLSLVIEPAPIRGEKKEEVEEDGLFTGKNSFLSSIINSGGDDAIGFINVYDDTKKYGVAQALLQSPVRVGAGASRLFGNVLAGGLETLDDLTGERVSGALMPPLTSALQTDTAQDVLAYLDKQNQKGRGIPGDILEILGAFTGTKVGTNLLRKAGNSLSDFMKPASTEIVGDIVEHIPFSPAGVIQGTADEVVSGGVFQAASDTLTGGLRQVEDFASRQIRNAQDFAKESRRLSALPEAEANLLRLGVDGRVVDMVKTGSVNADELAVYQRLVEQAKLKQGDLSPNTPMPKVIAGEEFLKPVSFLIERRNQIGSELGELRKTLSAKNTINTNTQFREFHRYLTEELGLRIDEGKIVKGNGRIADTDIPEIQKLYTELNARTFASEKWVDEWLQRTFKEFDLRQAREQTFSDDVSRVAERARSIMRQTMPENYNALSTQYAEVIKPIQDVVKLLGFKGDIDKLTLKELRAAEIILRVLGNAADRPQSVINDVVEVATREGYKGNVDLNRIITFTDALEDLYDITPTRGFSGSTSRGIEQSLGTASDIASLNALSFWNRVTSSRATQKEIQEALEEFIESLSNPISSKPTGLRNTQGGFFSLAGFMGEPAQAFKNFEDLSTKLLSKLEGRTTVSKQFISDLTNSPDLKQAERDLFREILNGEGETVDVPIFANRVKSELLPLQVQSGERGTGVQFVSETGGGRYENITLPSELRGNVAKYSEKVYESPIKTSAGDIHFGSDNQPNYFAHTRIEDLPSNISKENQMFKGTTEFDPDFDKKYPGSTRRVIELQSDLFQKGRLEKEVDERAASAFLRGERTGSQTFDSSTVDVSDLKKLEPYRNTWQERIIREEVKQAAIDGKTKLQFPTGETAMKIEGLGTHDVWKHIDNGTLSPLLNNAGEPTSRFKLGATVVRAREGGGGVAANDQWIITDVLGDGKFKAVPKESFDEATSAVAARNNGVAPLKDSLDELAKMEGGRIEESFDISGKIDTENPIYKFYEKEVGRYLKNKYNATLITDPQGVKWWEVEIEESMGRFPIEAFAVAPFLIGSDNE